MAVPLLQRSFVQDNLLKKLFSEIPFIQDKCLVLKRIEEKDADFLRELTANPNVYKYLPTYLFEKK